VRAKLPLQKSSFSPATAPENCCLLRHGVDGFSPSSWEPQEEGMMSTAANFPSVRNQGMSNPEKSQTQEGDAC
jgi:hypothetical protein